MMIEKKYLKEITKIGHIHDGAVLRHTFATLALQKNISITSVQKILGHDRLAITAIYLNLTKSYVMEECQQK